MKPLPVSPSQLQQGAEAVFSASVWFWQHGTHWLFSWSRWSGAAQALQENWPGPKQERHESWQVLQVDVVVS